MRAASVNPADTYMMRGWPYVLRLQTGLRRPKNIGLGLDFAGIIDRFEDLVHTGLLFVAAAFRLYVADAAAEARATAGKLILAC